MIAEVKQGNDFLVEKFGSLEKVPTGKHPVPVKVNGQKAFLSMTKTETGKFMNFKLFKDKAMKERFVAGESKK